MHILIGYKISDFKCHIIFYCARKQIKIRKIFFLVLSKVVTGSKIRKPIIPKSLTHRDLSSKEMGKLFTNSGNFG